MNESRVSTFGAWVFARLGHSISQGPHEVQARAGGRHKQGHVGCWGALLVELPSVRFESSHHHAWSDQEVGDAMRGQLSIEMPLGNRRFVVDKPARGLLRPIASCHDANANAAERRIAGRGLFAYCAVIGRSVMGVLAAHTRARTHTVSRAADERVNESSSSRPEQQPTSGRWAQADIEANAGSDRTATHSQPLSTTHTSIATQAGINSRMATTTPLRTFTLPNAVRLGIGVGDITKVCITHSLCERASGY